MKVVQLHEYFKKDQNAMICVQICFTCRRYTFISNHIVKCYKSHKIQKLYMNYYTKKEFKLRHSN